MNDSPSILERAQCSHLGSWLSSQGVGPYFRKPSFYRWQVIPLSCQLGKGAVSNPATLVHFHMPVMPTQGWLMTEDGCQCGQVASAATLPLASSVMEALGSVAACPPLVMESHYWTSQHFPPPLNSMVLIAVYFSGSPVGHRRVFWPIISPLEYFFTTSSFLTFFQLTGRRSGIPTHLRMGHHSVHASKSRSSE